MTFQLDFATIASFLSIILAIVTLLRMAVKEGERREAMRRIREDLDKLSSKYSKTEDKYEVDSKLLAAIKATLDALVKSVEALSSSFARHIELEK